MMTTGAKYRVTGDIILRTKASTKGVDRDRRVDVYYGNTKTNFDDVAIVQRRRPLTPTTPYFVVEVQKCDPNAIVSIGIAPLEIDNHAGQYNNSLGYYNNTGRIYTSWKIYANTLGPLYGKGNRIGIYVTYFGEHLSTVLIFYDDNPIATRYHFESNKNRYLSTITFSGGRAHVTVSWPSAAVELLPSIANLSASNWIRGPLSTYDSTTGIFENPSKIDDLPIQSSIPLSKSFRYFVVTHNEVSSTDDKGASVGLATCSPLKPTPTCSLMKDYYTWFAKRKMKAGDSTGWGIYYDEDCQNDKAEQLCLVFVMFNKSIADTLFVLQPEGGFFPIVLLQPYATKASVELNDTLTIGELNRLQEFYKQMLGPAVEIYQKDKDERDLSKELFRKSEQVLLDVDDHLCRVSIPRTENSIHYIQFCRPLTYERRIFFVELENIKQQCQVTVGIASSQHELNEAPGLAHKTVGYNSFTGKLYSNRKDSGNMHGQKCKQGDTIGVEIAEFNKEMSVVLFSKNFRPIGTRYLTLDDHSQYFPTILIESFGAPVELLVYWQTRVSVPPDYNMRNPENWCIPYGTSIDLNEKRFMLPQHSDHSLCIQAPCSLSTEYNHFEIVLLEEFSDIKPPPAIALCSASPSDPPPTSQFKQDYLSFWPTGDAEKYLKQGDRIGWGILFPQIEDNSIRHDTEQLIICYLTVNRTVGYIRVLYQPIGGFYPVVIAPPNINLIQMDFSATLTSTEEFTSDQIKTIIIDAQQQIEQEQYAITSELMTTTNNNDPTITNTNPMAYYNSQYDPYTMNLVAHHNSSYNPYVTHSTAYYKSQHDPYNVPTKSTACIIV